jgi:hypothetical protein
MITDEIKRTIDKNQHEKKSKKNLIDRLKGGRERKDTEM